MHLYPFHRFYQARERRGDKLKVDGEILQELAPAGWSPLYGMLKDRFGITWIVDVQSANGH